MRTQRVTHTHLLSAEIRAELKAGEGEHPSITGARILAGYLSDLDLMDPRNVGTTLLISGVDFSFLLPEQPDGEFATIGWLIHIHECQGQGLGELSDHMLERYRNFFSQLRTLMTEPNDDGREQAALAA